jgi:P4 family phage/plasmid primase-like protien
LTRGGKPPPRPHLRAVTPEEAFADNEAFSGINGSGPPVADDILPSDDHATLAKELARDLDGAIFADERFYRYEPSSGRWREVGDREIGRTLQGYSRRPYFDPSKKVKELKVDSHDVRGATDLARGLLDRPGFFDGAPSGLAFSNGMVVIRNGAAVLLPHDPENRVRHAHPFPFDPRAPRFELEEFFDQLFADVGEEERAARIMLLQEFAGAAAFGLCPAYQRCLVLFGKGGQGKSQALEILRSVFPSRDSIASLPPHMWGEQFAIEGLAGKLANIVDEIPETEIVAGATFKGVISGEPVTAERKYQSKFVFRPVAGHVFSCNHLPTTADLSEAFFDRFLLLPLTCKLRGSAGERPNAAGHVISACLPGIAAWSVEGAVRLIERRRYAPSGASAAILASWRQDCDNVSIFASERCRPANLSAALGPGNGTRASALYATYREWSSSSGFRPVSIKTFSNRLENLGIDKGHQRDGWYWGLVTGAASNDEP